MSNVIERSVKRYFYNGKSYGSRLRAYKARAKDVLMTEVFGPVQDVTVVTAASPVTGEESSYAYQSRPGFREMDDDIAKWLDHEGFSVSAERQEAYRKELFARKMRDFGFTCEDGDHPWIYGTGETDGCPEHFGFCGRAYKAWIDRKARELMKQDGVK